MTTQVYSVHAPMKVTSEHETTSRTSRRKFPAGAAENTEQNNTEKKERDSSRPRMPVTDRLARSAAAGTRPRPLEACWQADSNRPRQVTLQRPAGPESAVLTWRACI